MSLTKRFIAYLIFLFTFFPGYTPDSSIAQQGSTVAVWDFDNRNPAETIGPDMGELLAIEVIETLEESGAFKAVARQHFILALEELGLSMTSLVDESTRLRIGRIVGARFMLFGSYFVLGEMMRLDMRMVEVETTKTEATQKTTSASDINDWLRIAREAAQELIEKY